jgi:hypothetical protein
MRDHLAARHAVSHSPALEEEREKLHSPAKKEQDTKKRHCDLDARIQEAAPNVFVGSRNKDQPYRPTPSDKSTGTLNS